MIKVLPTLAFGFVNNIEIVVKEISLNQMVFIMRDFSLLDCFQINIKLFNLREYCFFDFCVYASVVNKVQNRFYQKYVADIVVDKKEEFADILASYEEINERRNPNHALQKIRNFEGIVESNSLYPYDKDYEKCDSYKELLAEWFISDKNDVEYMKAFKRLTNGMEIALEISEYNQYEQLIGEGVNKFFEDLVANNNLCRHPIANAPISRIYLGNEFCPNSFPDMQKLNILLNLLTNLGFKLTICYPYLQECHISQVVQIFEAIEEYLKKYNTFEFIVNDWGILKYIQENNINVKCILGRLLNKRKKDPRAKYLRRNYINNQLYSNNNFSEKEYMAYLKENNIDRIEFEDGPQLNKIPEGKHSLHVPYYQINTSTFCNLCADLNTESQKNVRNCSHMCNKMYYDYPKHLNMIGIGNTIYGFNKNSILFDIDRFEYYVQNNIDRIVIKL